MYLIFNRDKNMTTVTQNEIVFLNTISRHRVIVIKIRVERTSSLTMLLIPLGS